MTLLVIGFICLLLVIGYFMSPITGVSAIGNAVNIFVILGATVFVGFILFVIYVLVTSR